MEDNTQETGLLGGTTEEDFKTPDQEEDTSVNVFDAQEEETEETVAKLERPEGLPEQFWDEENSTFKGTDLYNEYKKEKKIALDLRQKISKGQPQPPESPDSYQVNHERIVEELGYEIPEDDAGIAVFKKVAFENGLDQDKFENILTGYMKEIMNHPDAAVEDSNTMSEEQQAAYQKEELGKLGGNADVIIKGIKNWNQQLFYDGVFSEDDLKVAQNMGFSAAEIRVLNKYRESAGNLSIPDGGSHIDGMESQQEIDKILASPEYEKDPVLQKKVSDYYHKKYS